ncbi:MAG TPA: methyltransferase domain-containing protein [Paucimonas sp.]|nr:methyltransferase domain-containing protein [Paucimonas sp.]HJW54824.1 methyltransferase domain-containing protein [Burkholderiaceae bacterium]
MFDQFPKTRPPLPGPIEKIHAAHYRANRDGATAATSLAQKLEAWMHRKVAQDIADRPSTGTSTLEIGAGTLNQLQYEPVIGPYDIVEPFSGLHDNSPLLSRVRNAYADIAEVPGHFRYDRITSVAAFEHVLDLPELVARCGLLLADGGVLRVAIPSEGTLLWTLGWKLTTGLEFRLKYGLDYGLLMRHEHVNSAREIAEVLEFFFADVKCSVFGLARPLSLYQFHACRNPRIEKCHDYASRQHA